jgi:hypothetical protein
MQVYDDITKINTPKLLNEYYIYVIENDAGMIKVGISQNAGKRIRSLSGSNTGGRKHVRYAVSSPTYLYTLEALIHRHFDQHRIKGTEWFYGISFEDVVAFVDSLFNSESYERLNLLRRAYTLNEPIPEFIK